MFWFNTFLGEAIEGQARHAGKKTTRRKALPPRLEELEAREVPALLGQQLFPSDNAWNQKITNAPVASNSANVIAAIDAAPGNGNLFNDFYHDSQNQNELLYGIPINIVHGNSVAKVNVIVDGYPDESDLFAAPIPTNAVIEGDYQGGRHRTEAQGNDGDRHLIIWDVDNNIAYEFYGATPPSENGDNKWHALQETVWDMKTNTFYNPAREVGWTSVDAAGLSVLAGLARPDEGLPVSQGGQGVINHALRFTLQNDLVLNKYIYPASHHANPGETDVLNQPPMGARFRLKADVDISGLNPQSKVVAQALKDYGLILADNGSNMFINGASSVYDPDTNIFWTWDSNDLMSSTAGLRSLNVTDFEMVDLTPKVTGLSSATGPAGTTLTIIGQNFSGAAGHLSVFFGSTAATNVTYIDDAHISVTVPAGTGTVDVTVRSGQNNMPGDSSTFNAKYPTFGYGTSANTSADNFTYGTGGGNQAPTVAIAASASPAPVNGTTTGLSVQGADDSGAANLTYTWAVTAKPASAANPIFSANGTNAARNSTATFSQAGSYTFTVTIQDTGGLTTTSSVTVTVNQTLTSIVVTPGSVSLAFNGTRQFSASGRDQFGATMTTQPTFTWTVNSGPGSVSSSGLYTAGTTAGIATIRAASGAVNGSATATVANATPTVQTPPAAIPNPVPGTTTTLTVLGADDAGEAGLTYTWAVTNKPASAANPTFSVNGTNASKSTTATFSQAGAYTFSVTIRDANNATTTSSVNVTVNQTLTSIVLSPASVNLALNGAQQFAATARDQFGANLTTQPAFTWSIVSGPGSVNASGLYGAGTTAGTATIRAASGAITGTATAVVGNNAPTVATAASANPSPVTGTTAALSVLGADDAGEAGLTYTWAVTTKPASAANPTFSANGTNASKSSTVTFSQAGAYTFTVTIRDANNATTTSNVNVTVNQTLTSIVLSPASVNLALNGTQQFAATARDQFGANLATQPAFTWTVLSGPGSVSSSGLYSAGTTAGTATIRAASGAVNGTATAVVGNNAPTVATPASATPSPATGTTAALSVLGADDASEAALTYTWASNGPAAVTFSANGTNASKNSTATFSQAGAYSFTVTIRDSAGLTTTSSVNVTVNQTLTSIVLTPGTVNLALNGTQQFSATARDQFGVNLATQPAFTWSLASGPGSVNASGLYSAGTTAGTATVRATSGAINGTATAIVGNNAPTVATAASANPSQVTGTSAALSVLGADDGGEAGLIYTWAVTNKPASAANPTFSGNGTNASKSSTVTFSQAGAYSFTVTIRDANNATTTSSVNVTVNQTLTSIVLTPGSVNLALNGTQQFSATARDQFGANLATQPAFAWSIVSGPGSVNASGLYSAGTTAGTATVRAASGAVNGTAAAVVGNNAPTVATAASATPSPATGTTAALSVLGADDGGEASLTYTWAITSKPASAANPTFSESGTNSSKSTTATFTQAGAYSFTVTIRDSAGLTTTSSVNVTVNQTLTSIFLTPGTVNLALNGTQQFSATARDQFGTAMTTQPAMTWSLLSGPGSVNATGLYSAGTIAGTATVRAASGTISCTATTVVGNTAPTVATVAGASATPVTGTTVNLSALGNDDGGAAALTYTWASNGPAAVAFSANGTNASKASTATFSQAGTYTFTVTIRDAGGLTVTSSVNVTVNQTLTSLAVTPPTANVPANGSQQLTATARDQFGAVMVSAPAVTWSVVSGPGSVNATGLYSAGATAGTATVRATSGAVSGTASVTVLPPAGGTTNVTSQVRVTYSMFYSRVGTNQYQVTVTLTNTSTQPITGPIRLVYPPLPMGMSVARSTTVASLEPGKSATVSVVVNSPSFLTVLLLAFYPPTVYAG